MLGRASSAERGSLPAQAGERLAERRRLRRRHGLIALIILLLLLLTATIYGFHQNAVRISRVEILSADASLSEYATNAMQGSYLGIIPRDSIFFFPEERIRANILASHGDIAAVSISRSRFTGISIKVDYRVPIARWCISPDGDCYLFDTSGYIYATTTEAQSINPFILYESLADGGEPIGSTLSNADKLPAAFDFARQLATLGSPVVSVAIHDGEVDMYLARPVRDVVSNGASGTRVTYVLGREQDAFTALVSSRDNFNLADGSVDYVDLRFDGKVYVKRK